MLENLGFAERTAIDMRYRGEDYQVIAIKINRPVQTVREWFKSRGKLSEDFTRYVFIQNEQIEERIKESLFASVDEIARTTTAVMRLFNQRLLSGDYKPTNTDYYIAWKIQRVMQNLHTSVKPYDPNRPQPTAEDRRLVEEGRQRIKEFLAIAKNEPDDYVKPDPKELAEKLNL